MIKDIKKIKPGMTIQTFDDGHYWDKQWRNVKFKVLEVDQGRNHLTLQLLYDIPAGYSKGWVNRWSLNSGFSLTREPRQRNVSWL